MCSGALIWLFSLAWDAVKLTLKVGFICPFVVDDPTDLGATIVVAQALCLSIFNLSPTQKTCLFTDGNKANVSAGRLAGRSVAMEYKSRNRPLINGQRLGGRDGVNSFE